MFKYGFELAVDSVMSWLTIRSSHPEAEVGFKGSAVR